MDMGGWEDERLPSSRMYLQIRFEILMSCLDCEKK